MIDHESFEALDLPILMNLLRPISEMGRKQRDFLKPFFPGEEKSAKLDYQKVTQLLEVLKISPVLSEKLTNSLLHIENIRQTIKKADKNDVLELFEIYEIKSFIFFYNKIQELLKKENLENIITAYDFRKLFQYLDKENQNTPSFYLSNLYSEKLKLTRNQIAELSKKKKQQELYVMEEAARLLKLREAKKEIVVSRFNKNMIDEIVKSELYVIESENFANITFSIKQTDKYQELDKKLHYLLLDIKAEEQLVRQAITKEIGDFTDDLLIALEETGKLDWLLVRANFGLRFKCSIPEVLEKKEIRISGAENLPIKLDLKSKDIKFQPLDINFNSRLNIITGANMAGKTSILKLIGQFFYLAAFGVPLPCKDCSIFFVDFIFFSNTTHTSNRMDLSSFGAEVAEINKRMKQKGFGLFLIDEIARGTNPEEGEAFSRAILESFLDRDGFALAATHFSSPSKIKQASHYRIKGLSEEKINSKTIRPDLELVERLKILHDCIDYSILNIESGSNPPRAALKIAQFLGIENSIMEKAKLYLDK